MFYEHLKNEKLIGKKFIDSMPVAFVKWILKGGFTESDLSWKDWRKDEKGNTSHYSTAQLYDLFKRETEIPNPERNEIIEGAVLILRQEMKEVKNKMLDSEAGSVDFVGMYESEKECIDAIKTLTKIKAKA